jgi:uncharacterized protein YjbI with pentapeptide repeats
VLFYLAIAVGSVTHRNLLFESPVKLPFLNVDLPLIGFFVLGPAIFLIVHAYVLLHFVLLADKVGAFHAELQAQIADEDARTRLRRQLPSNIFVQFLAGPREVRTGVMGFLLRLIAQISLVAGPLALLVFFQLQFLPYHHEAISWWQRLAVVIDLALLWMLWPSVARGETTRLRWRDFRRGSIIAAALVSLLPVLLVFTIATFPSEWLDANLPSARFVPAKWSASDWMPTRWTSLHEILVGGQVDFVGRKPTSLWSNRLVLPAFEVGDHCSDSVTAAEPLSLRGRRLEGAVLISACLRKVDFTAAQLKGADLRGADLQGANFQCVQRPDEQRPDETSATEDSDTGCAQLQFAKLQRAQLQRATLDGARLQGAWLSYAQLQGASLEHARIQDAWLDNAQLQGATLVSASLMGADLVFAKLQGAKLRGAKLQGANLEGAQLQGAHLDGTELQGASLERARMEGASLINTSLQGAWLEYTNLQGALLDNVNLTAASLKETGLEGAWVQRGYLLGASFHLVRLQGAKLLTSYVQGAMFDGICAWRADARGLPPEYARVVEPIVVEPQLENLCDWGANSLARVERTFNEQLPEGKEREDALARIAILDPRTPLDGEEAMAKAWADLARSSPPPDIHEKTLAEWLQKTGCDANGAPYVIRGLLRNLYWRFGSGSSQSSTIAAAFLDETQCKGAGELTEDDKAKLREIRDRHPP